jgi:acetyl-CoA carboxylase biotin carboxyl carrier protein
MMTNPDKSGSKASKAPRVNLKDLKKVIDMMKRAELSEINIEQEGLKLNLKKDEKTVISAAPVMQMAAPVMHAAPAPAAAAPVPSSVPASAPPAPAPAPAVDGTSVASPMVGTLYRSPSPDSPPFVKDGSKVEVGQTVCIIEAMKLMNEIKAEQAGTITKFLVENAQAVEYGQPLYIIK